MKNGYKSDMVDNLIRKHKYKQNKIKNDRDKVQFVSAEYTNVLPNVIKTEFNKLNINVSFRTVNNLKNIFWLRSPKVIENGSGIYKLECDDCDKFYICLLYTSRCV